LAKSKLNFVKQGLMMKIKLLVFLIIGFLNDISCAKSPVVLMTDFGLAYRHHKRLFWI